MKIAIVGTGYVGLVSGICFAEMGNDVICVDIDETKVEQLNRGTLPIYEPGLLAYFDRNRREGRLQFTTSLSNAVATSEIVFLALPTPPGEDGSADLSYVLQVADQLGPLMDSYKVIVDKSTVPVGTADRVRAAIEASGKRAGRDFDVVSNPEFLREGVAVNDFMKPERVVIGTTSARARRIMEQLYAPFVRQGNPILVMDERSAELTKYAANAFLATKITFMNEIANICARLGADVDKVRIGMGKDSRIGHKFLYPGLGFGGSCFPKDVQALHRTAQEHQYPFHLLEAVLNVNALQHQHLVDRIVQRFDGDVAGKVFAVWGLAFKANTDDVRESPAHAVIRALLAKGAGVIAFDPEAIETTRRVFGNAIQYAPSPYAATVRANALVICTEWHLFRNLDLEQVRDHLTQPLIFDGRNLYDPRHMSQSGFEYYSVGRPTFSPRTYASAPYALADVA